MLPGCGGACVNAKVLAEEVLRRLLPALSTRAPNDVVQNGVLADMASALGLMTTRLDEVQRHLLMSTEQAPQGPGQWQECVRELKEELVAWRTSSVTTRTKLSFRDFETK